MADAPKNAFAGTNMEESVRAEKLKLLALVAEQGSVGRQIYAEAKARHTKAAEGSRRAVVESGVSVPETLLAEVGKGFDEQFAMFDRQLEEARAQEQVAYEQRMAAEALYKDAVAADRPTLEQEAAQRIREFELGQAAAAGRGGGGRSGGGGRGGGGSGSGGYQTGFLNEQMTLPLGAIEDAFSPGWVGYEPNLVATPIEGRRVTPGGASRSFTSRPGGGASLPMPRGAEDPTRVDRARAEGAGILSVPSKLLRRTTGKKDQDSSKPRSYGR